jgi:hypothetical protein
MRLRFDSFAVISVLRDLGLHKHTPMLGAARDKAPQVAPRDLALEGS